MNEHGAISIPPAESVHTPGAACYLRQDEEHYGTVHLVGGHCAKCSNDMREPLMVSHGTGVHTYIAVQLFMGLGGLSTSSKDFRHEKRVAPSHGRPPNVSTAVFIWTCKSYHFGKINIVKCNAVLQFLPQLSRFRDVC